MSGLPERDIKHIKEAVDSFENIKEVIVFGSRALGSHKQWADVDPAVIGAESGTISRLSGILNEEKPLTCFLDLVNYDSLPDNKLKKNIDSHGRMLIKY